MNSFKIHQCLNNSKDSIVRNWRDFYWWRNSFLWGIVLPIMYIHNNGNYILNEYWDNLIILDACRYDVFKEVFYERKMRGRLECRYSRGTNTPSFLTENFSQKKYNDIIYVTANPYVNKLLMGKFFKIIPVWKYDWDENEGTVLPGAVYDYALDTIAKYPDKRIIIHFLQPHPPYIWNKCKNKLSELEIMRKSTLYKIDYRLVRRLKDNLLNMYASDFYATINKTTLSKEYTHNLEVVMPYVEKLMSIIPGITTVTSDHGEAFGERLHPLFPINLYGHFENMRIESLTKVPWLITENDEYKLHL